jgi:hypothetical protein
MPPTLRHPQRLARAALLGLLGCGSLASSGTATQAPVNRISPEFQFVRLAYTAVGGDFARGYGRGASWYTDAPAAEEHFMQGVNRLTRIVAGDEGIGIRPGDPELFDFPFLYAVEVGHWELTDAQGAQLREHLLRGGFLMVDDFHGTLEWATCSTT